MHLFIIAAVVFLSYTCGAPLDSGAPTLNETKAESQGSDGSVETSPSIDWNSEFWTKTTPLPPIATLPDADKTILCQFLSSFQTFRMSLFAVTWAANMEFLSNAEKHFATEFREEMDRPGSSSSDEMNLAQANAILQNATAYEEYVKDNVVKKNTLQMYKKIFEGIQIIQKEIMDAAGKVKNSISKETAESEKEFLKSFENMEPNNEDIANLLNDLEIKLKHRYQCQNSLIL